MAKTYLKNYSPKCLSAPPLIDRCQPTEGSQNNHSPEQEMIVTLNSINTVKSYV